MASTSRQTQNTLTDGNVGPIDALLTWFCGDAHDLRPEEMEVGGRKVWEVRVLCWTPPRLISLNPLGVGYVGFSRMA
jgi:hypothetical protein